MRQDSCSDPKVCYLNVALSAKTVIVPYSLEHICDFSVRATVFFDKFLRNVHEDKILLMLYMHTILTPEECTIHNIDTYGIYM